MIRKHFIFYEDGYGNLEGDWEDFIETMKELINLRHQFTVEVNGKEAKILTHDDNNSKNVTL